MTRLDIANQIATELHRRIGSSFRGSVWAKGDHVRVYTDRGEYISVEVDGSIRRSQPRIAWGHIVDDVCKALDLREV